MVENVTWNKTGRYHEKKSYDGLFNGYHNRKSGDILVLLFSLDTEDRIPSEYEDLLPKPWLEIEATLKQGKTIELKGKARDLNVILLAAHVSILLQIPCFSHPKYRDFLIHLCFPHSDTYISAKQNYIFIFWAYDSLKIR